MLAGPADSLLHLVVQPVVAVVVACGCVVCGGVRCGVRRDNIVLAFLCVSIGASSFVRCFIHLGAAVSSNIGKRAALATWAGEYRPEAAQAGGTPLLPRRLGISILPKWEAPPDWSGGTVTLAAP